MEEFTELIFIPSVLATCVIGALYIFVRYTTQNHDFWEKNNIPFEKPVPFFGTLLNHTKKPIHEVDMEMYKKFGRLFGYYEGTKPILMIAEPALLKDILVKQFHFFTNRRTVNVDDAIAKHLLSIQRNEDWKRIRSIMSHSFSKLNLMQGMSVVKESTQTLIETLYKAQKEGKSIDALKIYGTSTLDFITRAAFSKKLGSLKDYNNKLVDKTNDLFKPRCSLRSMTFYIFPNLIRWFRMSPFSPSDTNFFRDVTRSILSERMRTGQTRKDFLQNLMDNTLEFKEDPKPELLKEDGVDIASADVGVSVDRQIIKSMTKKVLSINELVAQCVIFFLGGQDTMSSTLAALTYELALNPDIQEKLQQEIAYTLKETKGELTYDALRRMKYMENVIYETLRLYPPALRIERQAAGEYTLGDTGIKIPKGMVISIPVYAMHRDPEFFPNPDKFDPNRFTAEERLKRDPYCYQSFGSGPRMCLGMNFGMIAIKVCIAYIIANFEIKKCPKTQVPLKLLSSQVGLATILKPQDVFFSLVPRDENIIIN